MYNVAQRTYIQIERGHQSTDGILCDYCDGRVFAGHTLFQAHSTALQICLYYDDLELCNPLGSKRSIHKIGIFYFTFCSMVVTRVINWNTHVVLQIHKYTRWFIHTGAFYFTLGNCSPKLRSKMQSIFTKASSFSTEKGVGPIWDNGNTQTNGGWPQKVGKQIKTNLLK